MKAWLSSISLLSLSLISAGCHRDTDAPRSGTDHDSAPSEASLAAVTAAASEASLPVVTVAASDASLAAVTVDGIAWELTADPSTTLPMAKRGEFKLWIVARNVSSAIADTHRHGLSFEVNGAGSIMLDMAFGNGGRVPTWSALPPGENLREARGGSYDPSFGESLFPGPADYLLTLRQRGRVVATLDVRISP
jgi:hypothetical protein